LVLKLHNQVFSTKSRMSQIQIFKNNVHLQLLSLSPHPLCRKAGRRRRRRRRMAQKNLSQIFNDELQSIMRRAAALLSAPLRALAHRRASSFRQASTAVPRRFLPASAAAALAASGAAVYAYSSRVETAQAPAPASDQASLDAAAAARAGTVLPGLPDYSLEQVRHAHFHSAFRYRF
jgi:hypothetical protein